MSDADSPGQETVSVDLRLCVRCSACSTVAPRIFQVSRQGSRVVRQPEGKSEREASRAAALICPTHAITAAAP